MLAPSPTHGSSRSRLRWVVRTGDRFPTTRYSGWSSSMWRTPVRFGRPDRFLLEAASSGYQRRSVKVVAAARGMAVAPLTAELARSLIDFRVGLQCRATRHLMALSSRLTLTKARLPGHRHWVLM